MTTITVPREYGYVIFTLGLTTINSLWHAYRVIPFRKRAGVIYPTYYVDDATIAAAPDAERKHALYLYNCAQRAHGNFLENVGFAALTLLVAGVRYPVLATGLGLLWNLGRFVYAVGYTDGTPNGKGRLKGSFHYLGQLGLLGLTLLTGWKTLEG